MPTSARGGMTVVPTKRRTPRVAPLMAGPRAAVLAPPNTKAIAHQRASDARVARAFVAPPSENLRKYGFQTASQVSNLKARSREINRLANEIVTTDTLSPRSLITAKKRSRTDSSYQDDLNAVVQQRTAEAMAREQGRPSAIAGQLIEGSVDPLQWIKGGVEGVQAIKRHHYLAGTIGLAGLVPMLRPLRGVRAVQEGLRAAAQGERAGAVAEAAAQSFREGRGVILPTVAATAKLARRAHLKLPERQALELAVKESTNAKEAKVAMDHIDAMVHEHTRGLRGPARKQAAAEAYRNIYTRSIGPEDPFHRFPKSETDAYLRSKINPKNADKGFPLSPKRYGTVNGVDNIVVSGRPTVDEWVNRAVAAIPDQADRLKWKNWYREIWPLLQEHFGNDAIWILRGFGASQANASPAMGLTAVLRMMDDLKRGVGVTRADPMRYSAVAHSIMDAVRGTPVEEGVAKKLSDFIDSVQGRSTRTVMGHDERGGMPSAVDIHSGRDAGLVDNKLVNRLQNLHGLKPGEDFTVDMGDGVPSPIQYERVAEFYHQIADHLNATNFDGHNDWTPAEVQALGWGAIQKTHGADPEDMAFALNRNVSQIAMEVLNGTRGLGSGLPFSVQQKVTKDVAAAILPRLLAEENVYVQRLEFGAGGWQGEQSPNLTVHVIASPEQVDRIVSRAAQIFDQHDVWGVRYGVQVTKRPTTEWTNLIGRPARVLEIASPELKNPTQLRDFWNHFRSRLPEKERKNFEGYTSYTRPDGTPGIRIITPIGAAGEKALKNWTDKLGIKALVDGAAEDAGLNADGFSYGTTNAEVRDAEGAVGRASVRRRGDVSRPPRGGEPGLGDPLAAEARRLTEESIARHAGVGPRLRPGPASRIRPAPEVEPGAAGPPPEQALGERMPLSSQAEEMLAEVEQRLEAIRDTPGMEKTRAKLRDLRATLQEEVHAEQNPVLPENAGAVAAERLTGATAVRAAEDALRGPEVGRRAQAYRDTYEQAIAEGKTPIEAYDLASNELRGQYPKLRYKGFSDFSPEAINQMIADIHAHPKVSDLEAKRAVKGLRAAVEEHRVPQPNQIEIMRRVFPKETVDDIIAAPHDWKNTIVDVLNIPRALQSSFDLSALGRQAIVAGGRHPIMASKNILPMVRAAVDKNYYARGMDEMMGSPYAQSFLDHNGDLTDPMHLGQYEEAFATRFIGKIPGIRGSARAYSFLLNRMRTQMYEALYKNALQDVGKERWLPPGVSGRATEKVITEKEALESLASYINHATGRGEIRHLKGSIRTLNAMFFSPRLVKSRFNLLMNPRWYMRQTPYVRRQALRAMFQTVGLGMGVLAIAKMAGASVGLDPRSANFGKIKIGDTRFDIWGGFQPLARYAAQLATGTYISSTTGEKLPLGTGFGQTSRLDVLLRFMRSKEAPTPSLITDWLAGSSGIGQEFHWTGSPWMDSQLVTRLAPLMAQDAIDLYNDQGGGTEGILKALGIYGIGMWGIGTQTYAATPPKTKGDLLGTSTGTGTDLLKGSGGLGSDLLGG